MEHLRLINDYIITNITMDYPLKTFQMRIPQNVMFKTKKYKMFEN